MVKKLLASFASAVVFVLVLASPVLAIAPPDSTPTIDAINVYRSCLETNDQLYVIEYTITYGAPPSETVEEAFIFRLMDGATELRSVTAYAYNNNDGYDNGIAAIYFSAQDITDKGMGWVGGYTVVLAGNPTLSWTGSGCPYESSTTYTDWNDPMGQTLGFDVLELALRFSTDWGLTTTKLYVTQAGTTTLSSYGEDYFGTSISNLMTMQSFIFSASLTAAEFYDRDHPLTEATALDYTFWAGTWLGDAVGASAGAFNIDPSFVYGGIWFSITIALLLLVATKIKPQFEILLLLGGVMAIFGTLVHFVPMLIPVLIGVALVILFVFKRFLSPSGA